MRITSALLMGDRRTAVDHMQGLVGGRKHAKQRHREQDRCHPAEESTAKRERYRGAKHAAKSSGSATAVPRLERTRVQNGVRHDHQLPRHVRPEAPADHLPAEEVDNRQKQPAFGGNVKTVVSATGAA